MNTLSVLSFHDGEATKYYLALAVGQLTTKTIAQQWIFAFVIMGLLALFSTAIFIPYVLGKELNFRGGSPLVNEEPERRPLLDDE